jgi:dTMP kinase
LQDSTSNPQLPRLRGEQKEAAAARPRHSLSPVSSDKRRRATPQAHATGSLIAFEGLDQSGKQTQAEQLRDHLEKEGRECRLLSFPDYATPVGAEILEALHGKRDYTPDVMQLLYVTNRYEKRSQIESWLSKGIVILCDRYVSSSVAYGEAQGLDPVWLTDIQRYLPAASLTILLDIAPQTALERKASGRDRYERDLDLLSRVRSSYERQALASDWVPLNGERSKSEVAADIMRAVSTRLAPR